MLPEVMKVVLCLSDQRPKNLNPKSMFCFSSDISSMEEDL